MGGLRGWYRVRLACGLAVWTVGLAALARAGAAPDPTCVAVCTAEAGAPPPVCASCEPTNLCSELASTDRPAWQRCVAEREACFEARHECEQGSRAGQRVRASCAAAGAGAPACCARECAPALVVEPARSAGRWLFVDLVFAGLLVAQRGDNSGALGLGLQVESLFGARAWRGKRVPFRLGPSGAVVVTIAGDESEDVGLQLSAALTALLYARRGGTSSVVARPITLAAGVLADLPLAGDSRVGALARLSFGVTTTGQNQWKFLSGWLFAEGHYIPGGASGPDRTELMLGLRLAPFVIPMAFIPSAQDR